MKLKYKHIEAAREIRMWIGQVIFPGAIAVAWIMNNTNAKDKVNNVVCNAKWKFKETKDKVKKFRNKESQ